MTNDDSQSVGAALCCSCGGVDDSEMKWLLYLTNQVFVLFCLYLLWSAGVTSYMYYRKGMTTLNIPLPSLRSYLLLVFLTSMQNQL